MQLTHKIANEWNKQYATGGKPNAMALKKEFNTIKLTAGNRNCPTRGESDQ